MGALLQVVTRGHRAVANRLVAGVSRDRVRSLWWVELAARSYGLVGPRATRARRIYDKLFVWHDAALGRLSWPRGVEAVYAYEDAALQTLRRARRQGAATFWDSPAIHWRAAERIWTEESKRWPGAMGAHPLLEPGWKTRRKDEELALADVVCVASRFARSTLVDAAGDRAIVQVRYGFPVDLFRAKSTRPNGPFTVLAVGTQDLRKGTPYLFEAWRRAGLRDARLRLIGPMRLTRKFLVRYQGLFEHVRHLPRLELEREYQAADLLVFPTLGDGFGLVMQEAMCCGTPVLTTTCGGGPECITDGLDGWLVPPRDVDALAERLREAAGDRERPFQMGLMARSNAERYSWSEAEDCLAEAIRQATSELGH